MLTARQRQDAADQWPSWWRAAVDHATTGRTDTARSQGPELAEQLSTGRAALGAPPDFAGLADRPALRAGALTLLPEAYRAALSSPTERRRDLFRGLANGIAEDVAFDRGVGLDDLHGSVQVLEVQGAWWRLVAPGTVLCSTSAAVDPSIGAVVLRRVFDSAVGH